jgi:hypothetical protein
LQAVAAISATDVWAVGASVNSTPNVSTLIENWNGSSWSIVSSPNPATNNVLRGVAADSTGDVWAVGYSNSGTSSSDTPLVEQWDGTSWNVVTTASLPSGISGGFTGVAAIPGTNELWAVGTMFNNVGTPTFHTLIEQYDGTNWNIVPSPDPTTWGSQTQSFLGGIAVNNANDAWAVGEYGVAGNPSQAYGLYKHWDGTSWSNVIGQSTGRFGSIEQLFGISQIPGTDQFVEVGSNYSGYSPYTSSKTVVDQWNGISWNLISSPNRLSHNNYYSYLNSVAAVSTTSMWAVGGSDGYKAANGAYYPSRTLIEERYGSKWGIVSSPNTGSGDSVLNGVTLIPGTNQAWAVGSDTGKSGIQTLTEFYCDSKSS